MRRSSSFAVVGIVVAAATALAWPVAHRQARQPDGVDQLAWFAGCWVYTSPRVIIEEIWTRPAGGSMLGMSRTLRRDPAGDSTIAWEFIRVHARGTDLVYAAQPHNQPAAEFMSESVSDSAVVFANPAHDFPQRIIYRRAGKDSLRARVEGTQGARTRGSDFPYARVACDSTRS
ncbi:MAG: DUF6265 family protein [Gemmatimonadaceae bacterium]